MKFSTVIGTTILAGTAGLIAGTLFAPGKGKKTRKKIVRKGKLYKDFLVDNMYDFADSVSHPFESLEKETMRLSQNANKKAKDIKAEASKKMNA